MLGLARILLVNPRSWTSRISSSLVRCDPIILNSSSRPSIPATDSSLGDDMFPLSLLNVSGGGGGGGGVAKVELKRLLLCKPGDDGERSLLPLDSSNAISDDAVELTP